MDLKRLALEAKRRSRRLDILQGLFQEQKSFILDPSKRKAALCSRRAGKSYSAGIYLLKEALDPVESDVVYIGLTRKEAKKIMFRPLQKLNRDLKLGFSFNKADLTATAPNGNTIYMTGAYDEDDADTLRGAPRGFKLVMLDECASFKSHFKYLVDEVLEPTLVDTNGTMAMIGTPSANPAASYFYKVTGERTEGFSVHNWTILNNPHIPHAKNWLETYKKRKNWDDAHPIYMREWLGKWTTDSDTLVYKYNAAKNHYDTLPKLPMNYILGADLGYNDAFTINVICYSLESRQVWSVEQIKRPKLIPAQWAELIQAMIEKYEPVSVVGDAGALGKAIIEEFKSRYHIPIKAAEKTKKLAYIELCNGDLLSGAIQIKSDSPLASEMRILQWDPDKKGKEDERTPNDLCDSFLYAWREARHYLGETLELPPEPGTDLAHEREAKRMLERELEAFEESKSTPWWQG
jgi:hypothetical protein